MMKRYGTEEHSAMIHTVMTHTTTLNLVCLKVRGWQMTNQRSTDMQVKVSTETITATVLGSKVS